MQFTLNLVLHRGIIYLLFISFYSTCFQVIAVAEVRAHFTAQFLPMIYAPMHITSHLGHGLPTSLVAIEQANVHSYNLTTGRVKTNKQDKLKGT